MTKLVKCQKLRCDPCGSPATNLLHITESGVPATNAPGVLVLPITNNFTVFQLGSGVYNFTNWP